MMLPRIGRLQRTYRHLGRYRQIVTVLVRHGFGRVLEQMRVQRYLRLGRKALKVGGAPVETMSRGVRMRRALEELGPTFVKLGQLLSTRPDFVPLDIAQELEKLQDQAAPFPGAAAREIIERELRRPIETVFSHFDEQPLAAASLGQVHAAELADGGRQVVIKVLRPGLGRVVETDLEILQHLAELAERQLEELEVARPTAIVGELTRALEKETDYTIEAAHLRRFARMFANDPTVRIPEVFPELCTARVLTMERLCGARPTNGASLRERHHDPQVIARRGAEAVLSQIFLHGFFHSDPHPGNLLVLPGDVVGFIDLGQVGRLDRRTRYQVAELLEAMVVRDEEAVTDAFLALTSSEHPPQRRLMEIDVAELLDWHLDRPLGRIEIGKMVVRLLEIAAAHERRISPELFLVFKTLGTLESTVRGLDPDFELAASAEPVLRRLARERLSPRRLAAETWVSGMDMVTLVREIPGELRHLLAKLRSGHLKIEFEHLGLGPALHAHELTINRLVFAIVLAALLVASSLVALGDIPPKWRGIPIIGLVGYLLSGVAGLALLWSLIRRSRL